MNCLRFKSRGTSETVVSWERCLQRARENVAYVRLCSELLSTAAGTAVVQPELKELKSKVEWERSFEELRLLREVAMLRAKSPTDSVKDALSGSGRSRLFQWFPQWWGWYSTAENADSKIPETVSETSSKSDASETPKSDERMESLEDEILDAIADTVENNTILRRDTVFGQFNFTLKDGDIRLFLKSVPEDSWCVKSFVVAYCYRFFLWKL